MRRNPRNRFRGLSLGAMLMALVLVMAACGDDDDGGSGDGGDGGGDGQSVTVAAFTFDESNILAEIYGQALEANGFDVSVEQGYGARPEVLQGLEDGDVDLVPEYVGAILDQLAGAGTATADLDEDVTALEPVLADEGLAAGDPSEATDVDGLAVTQDTADEFGLETYSDLAEVAGDLTLGAPPECQELPLCIPGLQETYGIEFGTFTPLEAGPTIYDALTNGDIDVARVFTTDPPIGEQGLVVLEDDQGLNPAQNVIPVFREDVESDELLDVLNSVSAALTTEDLIALNAQVIIDLEDAEDVAAQWLEDNGLN